MLEKTNRIMEHVWLGVAIASAIWVAFETYLTSWEEAKQWFPVPCIALAMYLFRRFFRKRLERGQDQEA